MEPVLARDLMLRGAEKLKVALVEQNHFSSRD